MKSMSLMENWEFKDEGGHAQPLYVDRNGRVILFTLKPGQAIRQHHVPSSPFYVVILRGRGTFTGKDNQELTAGPNTLIVFDPAEDHLVRAVDELVFVGFLQGAPDPQKKAGKGGVNEKT